MDTARNVPDKCRCTAFYEQARYTAEMRRRFYHTVDNVVLSGERKASDQEKAIFKEKSGIEDGMFEILWTSELTDARQKTIRSVLRRIEAQKLAWQIYSKLG